ncbi:MAG: trigger factor [Planctomycetes bacterium]|nr:trigger factor [Planctomycetota bacterium]
MSPSAPIAETNQVKIEDAGPARKRITVTVSAAAVKERLETGYGSLKNETALPGFRKGRAPRELLQRRFGDALLKETRDQILSEAYGQAIEANKLQPVGAPEIAPESRDAAIEVGKPFTFSIEVEVAPEFKLPNTDGIEVKRPIFEIGDEHVDLEIRRQGYRFGNAARITGPFQPLDRLLCEVKAYKNSEEEPFFSNDRALVVIPDTADEGKGQLLGLMVEDLGPRTEGKKVGDHITVKTTGPDQHEREDLRGASIRIELQVKDADRIDPLSEQGLAEKLSLDTVDNLKGQVRLALERQRDAEQRSAEREQVYAFLAKSVDFPLPEKLTLAQSTRNIEMARMDLLQRGVDPNEVETKLAEIRGESEANTQRRLKLFFILGRLAEEMKIDVTEAELNARIAGIAMQRGTRPDQLRNEIEKAGKLNELAHSIREHKTADRILEKAKFTDIPAEQWNDEQNKQIAGKRAALKGKAPAADKPHAHHGKSEKSHAPHAKSEKPDDKSSKSSKAKK